MTSVRARGSIDTRIIYWIMGILALIAVPNYLRHSTGKDFATLWAELDWGWKALVYGVIGLVLLKYALGFVFAMTNRGTFRVIERDDGMCVESEASSGLRVVVGRDRLAVQRVLFGLALWTRELRWGDAAPPALGLRSSRTGGAFGQPLVERHVVTVGELELLDSAERSSAEALRDALGRAAPQLRRLPG